MILTLADSKNLKESISVVSDLVKEATFHIGSDGLELIAMDPATVAMVIFKLLPSAFIEYKIDEPTKLAINLDNFKQILKRAKADDLVSLSLKDNTLEITFKSKNIRKFSLPIIEIDEREQKVPNLEFSTTINLPSTMLSDAVEDTGIISDAVAFIAQSDKFTIRAEGNMSKANIDLIADDDLKINCSSTTKAKYSVDYLKKMISGSKLASVVKLEFSESYPLKVTYQVVDKLSLSFILAPRTEND